MFYASNLCTECLPRVIAATSEFKSVRPIGVNEKAKVCRCGAEAMFVVLGTPELKNALSVERTAVSEEKIAKRENDVLLVRELKASGMLYSDIAAQMGISESSVRSLFKTTLTKV